MPTTDSSTPEPTTEIFAEAKTQQYGYIRAYRAVVLDCGIPAAYLYGILEDYSQLGARTGKGCVPSHKYLAHLMGTSDRSVIRYLVSLRDKGWVTWEVVDGKFNRYSLPMKICHTPMTKCRTPYDKMSDNQEQENKTERTRPPLSPTGDYTKGFEMAWTEYPHGTNSSKRKAYEAWKKLTKEEQRAATDALPLFKASRRWREGFIPHASTYLHQRLWETPPDGTEVGKNGHSAAEIDADIARIIARAQENQPA